MKVLFLVALAGLCAIVYSGPTNSQHHQTFPVTQDFLQKQKSVLTLYKHVNQPSHWKDHVEIAKNFNLHANTASYTKPEIVKEFLEHQEDGFLHKGEIFSVFHHSHWHEAYLLFKLFYYAKDFQTFYHTAVWARQHINEGVYLYALSVAVAHRADTYGIIIPPIYEIYPYYFYNTETIHKAQYYKQVHDKTDNKIHTIVSNYSGHYLNLHPEQALSYYLEDVGINAFYYYYNIYYPVWMDGEEFGLKHDKRGEHFYFVHQQLLARYYLERLSHGAGEIHYFNWDVPFETPYHPSLQYQNGLEFPSRPKFAHLQEVYHNYGEKWSSNKYGYSYTYVHDYERRIRDAIDRGFVLNKHGEKVDLYTKDGLNVLGNIIEANHDSPNYQYYGPIQVFARHLLGYSYQPLNHHKLAPSALEHYETSLRDPAFYQLYKKLILYFYRYQTHQPAYTKEEIQHKEFTVNKFEIDRLVTYFDHFDADLTNAVYTSSNGDDDFHVRVKQQRLNHKPFTYRVHVHSEKDAKVSVRVFLGPKYDEYGRYINISENRVNFVIFDQFEHDLKQGENEIQRHSYESPFYGPDRTTYDVLYKKVVAAAEQPESFEYDWTEATANFPQRFQLPHGSTDGTPYQFFVIVYPHVPYSGVKHLQQYPPKVGTGSVISDDFSLGYPFDRFIHHEHYFHHAPNMHFEEVKVYHRHVDDINASTAVEEHHHH